MPTGNAIGITSAGLVKYDGVGNFTGVTVTSHSVLVGGSSNSITSVPLTNGQLAVGSTGADPSASTLTAGSGISITNGAGSITIANTSPALVWNDVTSTSVTMAPSNGYLADNASLVTLTLPSTAAQFSTLRVQGYGVGGWKIAQNSGQQIIFGSATPTTSGTSGYLASTNANDSISLMATVGGTSTIWTVYAAQGNITIV